MQSNIVRPVGFDTPWRVESCPGAGQCTEQMVKELICRGSWANK